MKISLMVLLVSAISCNNKSHDLTRTDSIVLNKDTIKKISDTIENKVIDTINNIEISDSVIHIKFAKDSISTTVIGEMKGFNHPVTVYIPVKQGNKLTASISSDDIAANVRINQIFTPDGKADGPFGREWKLAIHKQGVYKLIIGENLMQGDEWKGKFKLRIEVK